MHLNAEGTTLRDEHGRHRVLHGINLVAKGAHPSRCETDAQYRRSFHGDWTAADIADLAARGFTLVRLGVIWAAVEPEPGRYDEDYLDYLTAQLDLLHSAGLAVLLDSHQDLYSQSFGDGAPPWATLTGHDFAATDLWSDAYLSSPAVQESLDQFWANAPGPGGVGLQDRFAAMWTRVAERLGDHPAVVGFDLLNEPAPGSAAAATFQAVIGAFAQAIGADPEQLAADFTDPDGKLELLARLEDASLHRQVGDAVAHLVARFETEHVAPFLAKVTAAVRSTGTAKLIAREHSYFANIGIPSGQPPLVDANWAYSPHGYDLTVDTPAIVASSNTRAGTIFGRHRETQERLGVPVIAGEWGAFGGYEGVRDHGEYLLDLFDSYGWSWTYWCWEAGFADTEAAALLTRPRPLAIAGDHATWRVRGGRLHAAWQGRPSSAGSVFYVPGGGVRLERNGRQVSLEQDGPWLRVPAGEGTFELSGD